MTFSFEIKRPVFQGKSVTVAHLRLEVEGLEQETSRILSVKTFQFHEVLGLSSRQLPWGRQIPPILERSLKMKIGERIQGACRRVFQLPGQPAEHSVGKLVIGSVIAENVIHVGR